MENSKKNFYFIDNLKKKKFSGNFLFKNFNETITTRKLFLQTLYTRLDP